jgi:hypothetical protein
MIPSIVQLSAIWFLPESPRWLIARERDDEALAALKKYHGNGEETELVRLEYEEIRTAIRLEQSKCQRQFPESSKPSGIPLVVVHGELISVSVGAGATTWLSMLSTPGNRYRIFLVLCMGLFSQWSGNGLISYCTCYLSPSRDPATNA